MNISKYRSDLHTIPEIGFKEFKTTSYIKNVLEKFDCEIHMIEPTGLIAFFDNMKKTTIGYRADIDALPVDEKTGIEKPSIHPHMMHACGHDAHMATLLGLAEYINSHKNSLKHNVMLLFQPSEESGGGARNVLRHELLEKLNIIHMFGLHVWPLIESGVMFSKSGPLLAKAGEIDITIHGKSCHVANSHLGIDALEIASLLLIDIYKYERSLDSDIERLLKFGNMDSGSARNILSDETHLYGTLRAFSNEVYNEMYNQIKKIANNYQEKYHCIIDIVLYEAYPPVINDLETFTKVQNILTNMKVVNKPFMQAEDFGYYCEKIPSVFFLLGVGGEIPLHNSAFYFSSDILEKGLEAFIKLLDI